MRTALFSLAALCAGITACSGGGTFHPFGDLAMTHSDLAGACGAAGEACCANNSCQNGNTCTNGVCIGAGPCGHVGNACCTTGTACTDQGSTCQNGVCITQTQCGHLNEACCNGTTCSDMNTSCQNGTCQPSQQCGQIGEPCCNGTCASGTCTNGTCVQAACGQIGQPCCNGVTCNAGMCSNGNCVQAACGQIGQPCCNGVTCNAGACVNGTCTQQQQQQPVGHTCTQAAGCSGPSAQCYTTIPTYNLTAAGGYCSNSGCVNDNGCGTGGFCDKTSASCFQRCVNKGDCGANNTNNLCFNLDGTNYACLPKSASQCDPTQNGTCGGTNACSRIGPDNVGLCLTTCVFGGAACPNSAQGQPQSCVYFNETLNGTGDVFSGTVCLATGTTAAGAACQYIDECVNGYECGSVNGGNPVCAQICKLGTTTCGTGTCQNAFQLGNFVNGSIGLCL